jgi:hypothetical protein
MNNNTKKDQKPQTKPEATVKYPELSDSELEIICGGGNLIGRRK